MKTIRQIADEIGVSKQAIHQKRKGKELSTALQPFTTTVDGVVYISVDGESLIKSSFSRSDRQQVDVNEPSTVYSSFTPSVDGQNELYAILKAELAAKNKLLDEQQQTIKFLTEKLTDALAASQQTTQAAQVLHAAEKKQLAAGDSEPVVASSPPIRGEHPPEPTAPQPGVLRVLSRILGRKQV